MPHAANALQLRPGESVVADLDFPPKCPKCGVPMEIRRAGRGARAGKRFWGCPNYWRGGCSFAIDIGDNGCYAVPSPIALTGYAVIGVGSARRSSSMLTVVQENETREASAIALEDTQITSTLPKLNPDDIVTVNLHGKRLKMRASLVFLALDEDSNAQIFKDDKEIYPSQVP